MVVCDICETNRAYDSFRIPTEQGYYIMLNGKPITQLHGRIEKSEVVLCYQCQRKIAKFINGMRESEGK